MELFLFHESQACPLYVIRIRAIQDTRTHNDDEKEEKLTLLMPRAPVSPVAKSSLSATPAPSAHDIAAGGWLIDQPHIVAHANIASPGLGISSWPAMSVQQPSMAEAVG